MSPLLGLPLQFSQNGLKQVKRLESGMVNCSNMQAIYNQMVRSLVILTVVSLQR